MTKFKVCLQHYVEKVATVEIEAGTPEEAKEKGWALAANPPGVKWGKGDDATEIEVYAVLDTDGEIVWER